VLWGGIVARAPWPKLAEMDAYRCVLDFHLLTSATRPELDEYYRYMAGRDPHRAGVTSGAHAAG
jgi:two-component system chemotaxis sensor kinase CheA